MEYFSLPEGSSVEDFVAAAERNIELWRKRPGYGYLLGIAAHNLERAEKAEAQQTKVGWDRA